MPARAVVLEQATTSITEADDYLEGSSPAIISSASPDVAETDPDTLSSDSLVGSGQIIATADLTGDDDTISVSATLTSNNVEATAAITDDDDTLSSAAEVAIVHASLGRTEFNDTLVAANQLTTHGTLTLTEDTDVLATAAQVLGTAPTVNATVALADAPDTVASAVLGQNVIAGVAVGQIGSGNLANYKLIMGDDFDFPVEAWDAVLSTSKGPRRYASMHINGDRMQLTQGGTSVQFYVDPYWRGTRSEVPGGINVNPVSVANSVMTINMAAPTDPTLIANLPTNFTYPGLVGGKPAIMSTEVTTYPWFQWGAHGDYVAEAVFEVQSGPSIGLHGGPWDTSTASWPDGGEYDFGEFTTNATTGDKISDWGLHINDYDGGPENGTFAAGDMAELAGMPTNRPYWVRMIKTATSISQWDDRASQGTLALRWTYPVGRSARVGRITGAHEIKMSAFVFTGWRGGTFTPSQWPRTIKYHWWRVWGPSGGKDWVAPVDIGITQQTPGGSWAWTMPSPSTLYGSTPDFEEAYYAADGFDCPGIPTRNTTLQFNHSVTPPINYRMPGGASYNPATRAWSGTIPSTEGGRIGFCMAGSWNAGGAARIAWKWFDVAPAVQAGLFASQSVVNGSAMSIVMAYNDFHSGNLGPHTYTITKTSGTATGLTISDNGTDHASIAGTPTVSGDIVYSIACTNSVGQTTTVSRTLTVGSAVMTMDLVNNVYVYGSTTYASWALAAASGHWSFARASAAYYITSTGLVTTWSSGQFRTGLGGGRIEPARSTFMRQSSTISASNATTSFANSVTSVINNQIGPNNTANVADTQTCVVASATHYIGQTGAVLNNYVSGHTYEWNLFIKKGTHRYVQMMPPTAVLSTGGYANFDLDTGTATPGGTGIILTMCKSLANGWWWIGITWTATASISQAALQFAFVADMTATRNPTWAGVAETVYTWEGMSAEGDKFTLPISVTSDNPAVATAQPADDLVIVLPGGTWDLTVTFMDNSTQVFSGVSGTYHLPAASLNQFDIRSIVMS